MAGLFCHAQSRVRVQHVVFDVPFRLAGGEMSDIRWDIDSLLLSRALRDVEELACDTTANIKRVTIYSSVSPEGRVEINRAVGKARVRTAERLLRERLVVPDSIIDYDIRYIPWHSYLLPAIKADTTLPYRDEFIKIVYRAPNSKEPDRRRYRLRKARGGELWNIAAERYFPYMRKGGAIIVVEREVDGALLASLPSLAFPAVSPVAKSDLAIDVNFVPEMDVASQPQVEEAPRHALSIKTNALLWATLVANVGFEVKLAPRWSLDVTGFYSPWNMFIFNRKIRLFGLSPEVRYWWGDVMKRGHFLGLHGLVTGFNVQLDNKYRYQDPNHAAWGVGLSYGYAMPLDKKERWGVEFTIGVGYARVKYDKYEGRENGQFIERKTVNYFGPTRLGVNFSYRFDFKDRKGKRQ